MNSEQRNPLFFAGNGHLPSKNTMNFFSKSISIWAVYLACLTSINLTAAETKRPPNVIFVLADDLGWAELGCYGNRFNETPHLNLLARQGMRFTNAYASAPVCSPYRAAFLTGLHPVRTGIIDYLRPNSANALSTSYLTLPEVLKRNGYATGMIGKWHLTGYRHHDAEFEITPKDHGFGWDFGREIKSVGNGANFWPYVFRDQGIRWLDIDDNQLGRNEYLTDRLNYEAVDFIERNQDKPFFLYLSHYAPHTILNGKPGLVEKYLKKHAPGKSSRQRCYLCEDAGLGEGDPGHHWAADHNPHLAAMLESIDQGIGMISAKLEELGLTENTILIFTSDNGGESNITSNSPLRGGKSELYEGGIRVPLIVRWPQTIPAGTTCKQPNQNTDFYPTLLKTAGIKPDPGQFFDGVSMLEAWKKPDLEIKRDFLAWHYPLDQPHFLGGVSAGAIRSGNWKLIEHFDTQKIQLYSLDSDPGETRDLSNERPEIARRLLDKLGQWRRSTLARTPSPPLITESRQLYFAEHFNPDHLSQRLWYSADWKAEQGVLKRIENKTATTRVFLRDAKYKDAVIRFDFRLGDAKDVRLMTGSNGHYNTVLHLRPDHFFLQTAKDESVPYFSFRHGECAFQFQPDQWYTMTVEFVADEAIAHLDSNHLARAQHPIIDQERTYFALQVDEHEAEFDNLQILHAVPSRRAEGRKKVESVIGKFPVRKSIQEQFDIRRTNSHEWYFQRDKSYRELVQQVDQLDAKLKKLYPNAFQSHKETRQAINRERKRLLENNAAYKDTLFASYRANQAIDNWITEQEPAIKALPDNRRKAAINQRRSKYANVKEMLDLISAAREAELKLKTDYPQLFISDAEITSKKKAAYESLRNQPKFREMVQQRADAYYAKTGYLLENDPELKRLCETLKKTNSNK